MSFATNYDRPVKAKLYVHLDNGEKFEATDADLDKFGLVRRLDAYGTFDDHVTKVLHTAGLIRKDLTEAQINPLRYLVELSICHPQLLDHPEVRETDLDVVKLERALREAAERQDA